MLEYKVVNGTYLLGDILTDRRELNHYQLRNYENLRIYSNGFRFCYFIDLEKLKSSKILALLNLVGHYTLTVVLIRESVSL